jgi:cell shape-determining protein MreD
VEKRFMIAGIVSFVLGFVAGPPDLISQFTLGLAAAVLCLAILGGLFAARSVRQASVPLKKIITVLVICLAATVVHWLSALMSIRHLRDIVNR